MSDKCVEQFWAVVPAAGTGERMGAQIPKQYLPLLDKTVLATTLESLLALAEIVRIVVCVAPHDQEWPKLGFDNHARVTSTLGGASRAESVSRGLGALSAVAAEQDWILVHDAARPCVSLLALQRLTDTLRNDSLGGILAVPCSDTLKLAVDDQPVITKTLDRSAIWQAQTPQMFRFGMLRDALKNAFEHDWPVTDEASAMERMGHQPQLVMGEATNIKITTAADLQLAQTILAAR